MEEKVFETKYWKIILVKQQRYLGRCVVVCKRVCADLAELQPEEIMDFFGVVKKLELITRKAFDARMFNWCCLMNNAYQETIPNPQVHWHFRPRYDRKVTLAEEVFEDPNFGHHYLRGAENEFTVSEDTLKLINQKLQEHLR